jgi:hypothetical protein
MVMSYRNKLLFVLIVAVAIFASVMIVMSWSNSNVLNTNPKPSLANIRQMCYDKLVETGYSNPTEMMVNICAGTVVNGLAETRP